MKKKLSFKLKFFMALGILLVLIAIFAPLIVPNNPYESNPYIIRQLPSIKYPLGTDNLGRCILSRVIIGARTSIFASLGLVIISFIVGTTLGIISGYYDGALSNIIMRIVDVLLAFPQMVLAIAIAGVLGGSLLNAMIATGITSWTLYARLARSYTLSIKNEAFISVAKLNRCSDSCILRVHIFPNIAGNLIVNASTQIGTTLMSIAGLSFLGLGVTPPMAEWGSMINENRAYMQLIPWGVIAPSLAILITIMIFNYLGDTLRDELGGS